MTMYLCRLLLLLMFWHCLNDVAAVRCPDIHKNVGGTVLLQSCRVNQGPITDAHWKYADKKLINMGKTYQVPQQFSGRIELHQNLSLTLKNLRLKDTGVFSFVSELKSSQPPTIYINLQVHEVIADEPILTKNITWYPRNSSCTVWLDCISRSDVSINSTVGDLSRVGRHMQRVILPGEGDVKLTCTAYNPVTEKSVSASVRCQNEEGLHQTVQVKILAPAIVAGCTLVVLVVVIVSVCWYKKRRAVTVCDSITEYEVIDDVKPRKPAVTDETTLYETIQDVQGVITCNPIGRR